MRIVYILYNQQHNNGETTMRFSEVPTLYQAMKQNEDCFSFHRVEGGFVCFYCVQALVQWFNQNQQHNNEE